ncbi:Hypothetical protein FKW44_012625 [Caligus rogercresseyi]|uniref:Uncharacterized protein n=1 Tax=Caligus rogercresseyi TaxID=217165 RepID=A0A7T8HJQ9_CALRO|nr:Hypothetical protein FKW44_012625 [Caligus rogercresseyi]
MAYTPRPRGPSCRFGILFRVETHRHLWQGIRGVLTFNLLTPSPRVQPADIGFYFGWKPPPTLASIRGKVLTFNLIHPKPSGPAC